ncbi:transcriptional regulator with XRE-family HTH domain [Flavobacterium arsenatis]|uniref:Transcriptional regulator with XRE-family HTH domain n=1 Tax=Flavobacterium arsenatis TaxID=1484332 RepID=A0ABU1TJQ1_9FLAO|nr:transcriptional regulator with XRE-family HTH domain [Flavobacterium arsenatis]
MNKGVCSKIKQIRRDKNLSQDHMAKRLGITQSQFAKIENGHQAITLIRLVQISEIFDINPTLLFEEVVFEYYLNGSFQLEILNNRIK